MTTATQFRGGAPVPADRNLFVTLAEAIGSNLDLHRVLQAVTDAGTRLSGAEFGAFFYNARDERGELYRLHVVSGADVRAFLNLPAPRITPLFEPTFAGRGTTRVGDLLDDPAWSGMPPGHLPVRSYLATPVTSRTGDVIGALLFGHSRPHVFDPASERTVRSVAAQAAVAVENARLFEAEQAARQHAEQVLARLTLLQSVTARLATALSTTEVMQAVVDTIVGPLGAGRAGVHLRDGEVFRAVVGRNAGGPGTPQLRVLPAEGQNPVSHATSRRRPVTITSWEQLERDYPDLVALGLSGVQASVSLPLILGDEVHGALTLAWPEPRTFPEAEMEMLRAAAGQLASALERARLYEAERTAREQLSRSAAAATAVSTTLQRALLPRALPAIDRVELAVRYLPGAADVEVGGDWYDVVPRADGGVLVVGDVQGHSLAAAAVMGQLRIGLHAYLAEGHDLDVAVARANRLLGELDPTVIVTCCLVHLDTTAGLLQVVRAGHPQPLLRRADGSVVEVEAAGGVPLGVLDDAGWPVTTVQVGAGDRLVLYTDGLVERPGRGPDAAVAALSAAVAQTSGDPQSDADAVLAAVGRELVDDVALLVCDYAGPGTARRAATLELGPELGSVAQARRFAADVLTGWGLGSLEEPVTLVVSELATNALVHTGGPGTLELRREQARLRVLMTDPHTRRPQVGAPPTALATSGRGMALVEALALAWGVEPCGPGKTVWVDLAAESLE